MIIYKHIKTNATITLDDIKENLRNNILSELHIKFEPPVNFVNGEYIDKIGLKNYTYKLRDIPLSDDFEIISIDNEFNIEETHYLIDCLKSSQVVTQNNVFSSILNKLYKRVKDYNKYGQTYKNNAKDNIEFICLECDNIEDLEYEKAVRFFGSRCPKCNGYIVPRLQKDRDVLNDVELR